MNHVYVGKKGENSAHTKHIYCIRPNYRTVRLGFSKLLGKLLKYVSTYTNTHTKGTLKKDQRKTLSNYTYAIFSDFLYKSICCGYSFELQFK